MFIKPKQLLVTALVLLLGWGGALAVEDTGPVTKPIVEVPNPTFAFEQVVDGTEVLHDFVIKNKGDAPLDILKVKPG